MFLSVSLSVFQTWDLVSEDASELGTEGLDEEVPIKSAGDFNPSRDLSWRESNPRPAQMVSDEMADWDRSDLANQSIRSQSPC